MADDPPPGGCPCPQWRYEAAVYALGALSPPESDRFERHLRACATCRAELAWLVELRQLLGALNPGTASVLRSRCRWPSYRYRRDRP